MAILKAIKQETGVEVKYWKIENLTLSSRDEKLTISVLGYLDEQARKDDCSHIVFFSFQQDWDKTTSISLSDAYELLKAREDYIYATNC